MGEKLALTGMVLLAVPIGENDKRVVILTKERGKISAFAKGARRQNSSLLAAANPFSFGTFYCYEGRSSYNLVQADIDQYFSELHTDFEGAYYGFYFLEFADFYSGENNDESQMLNLLYVSLRALVRGTPDHVLVRYIYELKAMVINGEYPQVFSCLECGREDGLAAYWPARESLVCRDCAAGQNGLLTLSGSTVYTLQYIISAPLNKLYSFTVTREVFTELKMVMERFRSRHIEKKFKSLEVLNTILRDQ